MNVSSSWVEEGTHGAFSLVEVVLAIGVIALSAIGILSLTALSAGYSRESAQDTAFAFMTRSTISNLRNRGFTALNTPAFPSPGQWDDAIPDFYYDVNGRMALDANGVPDATKHADSIYSCTVTRHQPSFQATTNLLHLRLEFAWLAGTNANPQQRRVIHASICHE